MGDFFKLFLPSHNSFTLSINSTLTSPKFKCLAEYRAFGRKKFLASKNVNSPVIIIYHFKYAAIIFSVGVVQKLSGHDEVGRRSKNAFFCPHSG